MIRIVRRQFVHKWHEMPFEDWFKMFEQEARINGVVLDKPASYRHFHELSVDPYQAARRVMRTQLAERRAKQVGKSAGTVV